MGRIGKAVQRPPGAEPPRRLVRALAKDAGGLLFLGSDYDAKLRELEI